MTDIFSTNTIRKTLSTFLLVVLVSFSLQFAMQTAASAATFEVTTTAASGAGSLYQAIQDANATPALDTINFNISGAGTHVIIPPYGGITVTAPVFLNGLSQSGSSCGGTLKIAYDVSSTFNSALQFNSGSGGSTVQGIAFNNSTSNGILNLFNDGTTVRCNYFNMNYDASDHVGNVATDTSGLNIGGSNIIIGGPELSDRNYFGALFDLDGSGANITVENNVAGYAKDLTRYFGPVPFGNTYSSKDTLLIKNNIFQGLSLIRNGSNAKNLRIIGNTVCENPEHTLNLCEGISSIFRVNYDGITLGGPTLAERNYIAGGTHTVLNLETPQYSDINVENNFIGVNNDGSALLTGSGFTANGIEIISGGNVNVKGNVVASDIGLVGIDINHAGNLNLIDNRVGVSSDGTSNLGTFTSDGIAMRKASDATSARTVTIQGNIVKNAEDGLRMGNLSTYADDYQVDHNNFSDNANNGVSTSIDANRSNSFIFDANTITGNGNWGAVLSYHRTNAAINTVTGNGNSGLLVYGGVLHDNTVSNNTGYGIISEKQAEIYGNIVESNSGVGIKVNVITEPGTSIHQNIISDNGSVGLLVENTDDVSIWGNRIERNMHHGIRIYDGNIAAINQNTINENGQNGIDIVNNTNTVVTLNTILDNDTNGVFVSDHSNTTVVKNQIHGNQVKALELSGSEDILNSPIPRGVTLEGSDTRVAFTLNVPVGDYQIDVCYNPSGQVASGECEVWKSSEYISVQNGDGANYSTLIVGSPYEVAKLSMQITRRNAGLDLLGQSSGFGAGIPPSSDLIIYTGTNSIFSGNVTKLGPSSTLKPNGSRIYARVCATGSNLTSFTIDPHITNATVTGYEIDQDNSSATTVGSMSSNGVWNGLIESGQCIQFDLIGTTGSNVGSNITFKPEIVSSILQGGDTNSDSNLGNNTEANGPVIAISDLPDISVSARLKNPVVAGGDGEATYEATVKNVGAGASDEQFMMLALLLPTGATFESLGDFSDPNITLIDGTFMGIDPDGCTDPILAEDVAPGLAAYAGETMVRCVVGLPDGMAAGSSFKLNMRVHVTDEFLNNVTPAVFVAIAFDEADSIEFIGLFSQGQDGFILGTGPDPLNNIAWLNFDSNPLTVTINRCNGTNEVVEVDDACFNVTFNKAIYPDSFTIDDLVLTGGGTVYSFSKNDDTNMSWTVRITGMTPGGLLTLTLGAQSVQDYSAVQNGTQVLGENIVRFGVVAGGETQLNENASANSKAANGVLAATGISYDWYSPLMIILFGWTLLVAAKRRRSAD